MTDQERKAMQMALDALQVMKAGQHAEEKAYMDKVIEALRQALAQPEKTPFGYVYEINGTYTDFSKELPPDDGYDKGTLVPVFTAPPSKQEQGCGECGVKAIDGYALYCVKCVEPFFKKEQT